MIFTLYFRSIVIICTKFKKYKIQHNNPLLLTIYALSKSGGFNWLDICPKDVIIWGFGDNVWHNYLRTMGHCNTPIDYRTLLGHGLFIWYWCLIFIHNRSDNCGHENTWTCTHIVVLLHHQILKNAQLLCWLGGKIRLCKVISLNTVRGHSFILTEEVTLIRMPYYDCPRDGCD